ncbi:hypothetical protein QEN19_003188 [Hanseniaspora menglaensis]
MYIKKISIQGFKTFKNHLVVEHLSPNENIIIGSNGSGKSNLFAAIMFVIGEEYINLSTEDRLSLIYQGSGTVMSCFVEIEFSNGTTIRRTIGLKKDEFSIDGRMKSKNEVANLLQSFGFPSGENSYYMVPQGTITSLTNSKDVERLNLLKEVTGANVFEQKLNKSLKDMKENKNKRVRIDSELEELDTRLKDLNEENKHLVQSQLLEKEKKLLQCSIFERNLVELNERGNLLKTEYDENIFESQNLMQQLEDSEVRVNKFKIKLIDLSNQLKLKDILETDELSDIQVEVSQLEEKQSLLELKIEKENLRKQKLDVLILDLNKKIAENNKKIELLQPNYISFTSTQNEVQKRIDENTQKQTYLITKKGRYSKFVSQEERDDWLNLQITSLENEQNSLATDIESLQIKNTRNEISKIQQQIEEDEIKLTGSVIAEKENIEEELAVLQDDYYEIVDKRTDCWRQEKMIKTSKINIEQEIISLNRSLYESIDRLTALGLSNLPLIMEDLKLSSQQVIGKVGDVIQFSDKYKQCIETTGGNSLLNIIVDSDETAKRIMKEMAAKKLGRLTFMPLNRISEPRKFDYPDNEDGDFIPLIKKIKFDKRVESCINLIFAKTIVVKELTTGVALSKKYFLNAVTPDGDRVDGRGALTGGFMNKFGKNGVKSSTNRLDCLISLKSKNDELKEIEIELAGIENTLKEFDIEAENMNEQIQEITLQKLSIIENEASLKKEQLQRNAEISKLESQLTQQSRSEENLEKLITSLQLQIDILKNDLEQPFNKLLSDEETDELDKLIKSIQKDGAELKSIEEHFNEQEMIIEVTRHEIDFNLKPQLNQLTEQNFAANENLLTYNKKLMLVNKKLISKQEKELKIKQIIEESNKDAENLLKEEATNKELLRELYDEQRETMDKLEELQIKSERLMTKIARNNISRDHLTNKIVELGFISEDSLSQFSNMQENQLVEKLKEITVKLSKFNNVNKRAGESFARFLSKKDELKHKAIELKESEKSIETLIQTLKEQKIQAIESTFQKVATFFEEIFTQIVPRGKGKLLINKKFDSEIVEGIKDDVDTIYDGVAIQVSFNSKDDEQLFVDQLSGGQKTVCAIALILAIQRVNPAPFYLFDEIDAALDKEFRTSVANVIHALSHNENSNSQFICTTFRRELLNQADKFFRVRFQNKNSVVEMVDKVDAIQFVRGEKRQRIADI